MGQTIETCGDLAAKWDAHILYSDGSGFEGHVGPAAVVPRCRAARRYLGQGVRMMVSGPSQWLEVFVDVSAPGLGDCSILADDQVVTQAIRNQDRSAAHYTLKEII
ncbi:hypothetical protein IFM61392_09592 [Aspergillus lentulus]|nr:hypothetical protein IFM61392_09592 [Aspergillus lentulus]